MTYGRYRRGDGLAYRLDPRTKMLFVLVMIVATFAMPSGLRLLVLACVAVAALVVSNIRPLEALGLLRPFVWLMAFVLAFNAFFASAGVVYGLEAVARFVIVLLGTSSLMITTSPTELTDGVSLLLRPLARLGVHVVDLALSVGMTLRFVPVVMGEYERVKRAQEARFAHFDEGRLFERVRAYVPVMVPLFASALRRSRRLAVALENRGYGLPPEPPARGRSCLRVYRMHAADWAVVGGCALLLVLAFV